MGCDIHSYTERKTDKGWELIPDLNPFSWRTYSVFGFLADVRNHSAVPPIAKRRGFPDDASEDLKKVKEDDGWDCHSFGWLSTKELLEFDYDAPMEDRRVTREIFPNVLSGRCTCEPGDGKKTTYREFLGNCFFEDLEKLKVQNADRVVFWFNN